VDVPCYTTPEDDESVPHECGIATTALTDLADEIKAGK